MRRTRLRLPQRIAFLGLIPIEGVTEQSAARGRRKVSVLAPFSRPRTEDLTIFTGDLALLLRTGARINDALELLASDPDAGRIRPTLEALTGSILSGESFGEALAAHPDVFPAIYVALARVGEASGTLVSILEALSAERQRGEALRRRLSDALRYPAFLLFAAGGVLIFFLGFVLPQFSTVFRDFNAKLDPILVTFLCLSDFMRGTLKRSQRASCFSVSRSGCRRAVVRFETALFGAFHDCPSFDRRWNIIALGSSAAISGCCSPAGSRSLRAYVSSPTSWLQPAESHNGPISWIGCDAAASSPTP